MRWVGRAGAFCSGYGFMSHDVFAPRGPPFGGPFALCGPTTIRNLPFLQQRGLTVCLLCAFCQDMGTRGDLHTLGISPSVSKRLARARIETGCSMNVIADELIERGLDALAKEVAAGGGPLIDGINARKTARRRKEI